MIKFRQELNQITPYVPGKLIAEVQEEYGLTDIIKLASNENPLGMANAARMAINHALDEVHLYPDGNSRSLTESLAKHLAVNQDQLIVGNGSDEVLRMIGEAFLTPNDEVIVSEPTFSQYRFIANLMGAKIRSIPLKEYHFDLEAIANAISAQTKIVFICNPNNPTGTIVSDQKLRAFLEQIPPYVLVVIDEAYYEYVQAKDYPNSIALLEKYSNLIITRTFSKVYALAALRVGYGIAAPEVIATLLRVKEPFNVNLLAQVGAEASLLEKDHLETSIRMNEAGKEYFYREFSALNLRYLPTEANFILVDLKQDGDRVFRQLLSHGIIIRPTTAFKLPNWIRVTIGTAEQNQKFIKALQEVL